MGAEMPKSDSLGCPRSVNNTLVGLISRCRMPARWIVSTAPASFIAQGSTVRNARLRSERYRIPRFPDPQYSMVMYWRPSAVSASLKMCTIALCCAARTIMLASFWNRARASWSAASARDTFTATVRFGRSCSYAYTSANPPLPILRRKRWPGISGAAGSTTASVTAKPRSLW